MLLPPPLLLPSMKSDIPGRLIVEEVIGGVGRDGFPLSFKAIARAFAMASADIVGLVVNRRDGGEGGRLIYL